MKEMEWKAKQVVAGEAKAGGRTEMNKLDFAKTSAMNDGSVTVIFDDGSIQQSKKWARQAFSGMGCTKSEFGSSSGKSALMLTVSDELYVSERLNAKADGRRATDGSNYRLTHKAEDRSFYRTVFLYGVTF
ncbi:hypothetical protein [Brevibacillus sp. 1238]|uniref:hypothetical protein n=1 Tax=Brevibacillus sp. 1238 TaxID=2940565 RepID=UPI0024759007|nr:hypothetical protein [Brevibacillus sp. 1238]MDH6350914.1 hypothetical protein [Brevibacillus sp. 1238]